jgi:hypothetical protein
MNILQLSERAVKFYEASRPRNLYSGYEKNVLVRNDSESCLFVDARYMPATGDVIFRVSTINQATKIDLKYSAPEESPLRGKFSREEWIEMIDKMNGVLASSEIDPREEVAGELENDELAAKVRELSKQEGEALLTSIAGFWDNEKALENFIAKVL